MRVEPFLSTLWCMLINQGTAYLPLFDNCYEYTPPTAPYNTSEYVIKDWAQHEKEFANVTLGQYGLNGFRPVTLDFPIPIHGNPACVTLKGVLNTYVQIMVEPEEKGTGLCFMTGTGMSAKQCWLGQFSACVIPQADEVKYEFFCDESCQSSPINLHYRFLVGPPDATSSEDTNMWCENIVNNDFPSSLNPVPEVYPRVEFVKMEDQSTSQSASSKASCMLVLVGIAAAIAQYV